MAQLTQQQNSLHFKGDLLIANVSETLADLQKLQLASPLTLDFSGVKEVDTVAISMILEIQRRLNHDYTHTGNMSVVGVPDNLRSLMQLYGVDGFLLN